MKVFVARDDSESFKDGLFLYFSKPRKIKCRGCWQTSLGCYHPIKDENLPEGVNPKWTDTKPIELEMQLSIPNK